MKVPPLVQGSVSQVVSKIQEPSLQVALGSKLQASISSQPSGTQSQAVGSLQFAFGLKVGDIGSVQPVTVGSSKTQSQVIGSQTKVPPLVQGSSSHIVSKIQELSSQVASMSKLQAVASIHPFTVG